MSRFFSEKFSALTPYVPGEQPKDTQYVKLNTNESPFPPSKKAREYAKHAARKVELYSDPECTALKKTFCELYGVKPDEVIFTNGSDEALNFAFMAFCDDKTGAAFPDITYGFYPVFARLYGIDYREIPLKEDFSIDTGDYKGLGRTIFIANPNAPTGMTLTLSQIEEILSSNPDNVVVIDEAYVDFGGESAVSLIPKYDNLLVTQTFSKSRSLAGARLGFAIGSKELIADLNTLKYSTNPYNVNAVTQAMGRGALEDEAYTKANCETIKKNRAFLTEELQKLGFCVLPSKANFVFAKSDRIDGEALYLKLKERGVLIRHFTIERIKDYNRITVGAKEQIVILIKNIKEILEEQI
ncbi:MAG: histidinol-phosphate transaminase [Ruminococcus sp.]|nr:histidinol-phosphate transaminase [Ruminococcus sp.]MBR0302716.1 histidinol-phosphate transaminase [Clostridia bacterium]